MVVDANPLTNRNWCRAPASTFAAAEHGSLSTRHVVDDEDTEDDDENSDGGKQLAISPLIIQFITYLHPSSVLRLLHHIELVPIFFVSL